MAEQTTHINLEIDGEIVTLFAAGFTRDGGFFVCDLLHDGKKFLVSKYEVDMTAKVGTPSYVPLAEMKMWFTSRHPKITHHVDGTAHVSGSGIISGFYKYSGAHKGVSIASIDLKTGVHDGGPVLVFGVNNVDLALRAERKDGIVVSKADQIVDWHWKPEPGGQVSYIVELFYFKNSEWDPAKVQNGKVTFHHPDYGRVPMRLIPCPKHFPGQIGIFARKAGWNTGMEHFDFSISGGPGLIQPNGKSEQMSIVYPLPEDADFLDRAKCLNFGWKQRLLSWIDDTLYHWFR